MADKGRNLTYERAYEREKTGATAAALPTTWQTRLIEALPGVLSWLFFLAPIWLTLVDPVAATIFIGAAVALFLIRAGRYGLFALLNRKAILEGMHTDWLSKLDEFPDWPSYRVIVLIRAFREGNRAMLAETMSAIYRSHWPKNDKMMQRVEVVFATEENDPITPALVEDLAEEFRDRLQIRQVIHPPEPGVLPGPSSAMHYVGRVLYREATQEGADPERILVADMDADTVVHPNYLPSLMFHYLADSGRDRHVYQPVVLFTLDYWQAPLHSRLAAISTSALTLGWNREPEIAFTGAAASLALLESVDFWPTKSHSQDSGIDLKLRMRYGGDYRVVGLPVPLKVYPVMIVDQPGGWRARVGAYLQSARVLFRQSARWREGPLDEFVEATQRGKVFLSAQRLWSGLERDTLTFLPGAGFILAKVLGHIIYPGYSSAALDSLSTVILTLVSTLGLAVFLQMLSQSGFVDPRARTWRRILEIALFWTVFSFYVPVLTAIAGLKTSTVYALGRRPTGHYVPTPK